MLSIASSALADEVPSVCSQYARRANKGDFRYTFAAIPRMDGAPRDSELCLNLGRDGHIECVHILEAVDGQSGLYLELADGSYVETKRDFPVADEMRWVIEGQYVLDGSDDGLRYLNSLHADGSLIRRCEFEVRDGFAVVLTPYETFVRAAGFADRWAAAFQREDTASADMLLAHEGGLPVSIDYVPPVTWTIVNHRPIAMEWLLQHGVAVNGDHASDMPIVRAVWEGDGALAVRLLGLGADPARLVQQLSEVIKLKREYRRVLIPASARSYGYIAESVMEYAIKKDPALLDDLIPTGLRVGVRSSDWLAGEPAPVPLWILGRLWLDRRPELLRKIARVYAPGTVFPPRDQTAILRYGSFKRGGLLIERFSYGHLSDEEMLKFATAVCIYFVGHDCGPRKLQKAARAWAAQLSEECPAADRRTLSPVACKVITHYTTVWSARSDGLLIARLTPWMRPGGFQESMDLDELKEMYRGRRRR
jgi:hypothetical protein